MNQIIRNQIMTPDGTILCSRHVHDYVDHVDTKTGRYYAVDGGFDYLKRVGEYEECTEMSVFVSDPHPKRREAFVWKAFTNTGYNSVSRLIKLSELSDEHIVNILATQRLVPWVKSLFLDEQVYRHSKLLELIIKIDLKT